MKDNEIKIMDTAEAPSAEKAVETVDAVSPPPKRRRHAVRTLSSLRGTAKTDETPLSPAIVEELPAIAEPEPPIDEEIPLAEKEIPLAEEEMPLAEEEIPLAEEEIPLAEDDIPLAEATPITPLTSEEAEEANSAEAAVSVPAEGETAREASSSAERESSEATSPSETSETASSPEESRLDAKRKKAPLAVTPYRGAALSLPRDTVRTLRIDLLLALLPLLVWAVYLYGWRSLTLTLIAVASACLLDLGCQKWLRHRWYVDTDSAVIGVLIALGLPPTAPLWLPLVASAIAVLPVRLVWKGKLRQYGNPAVTALLILTLLLPGTMTHFSATGEALSPLSMTVKGFAEAGESILDMTLGGGLPETDTLGSIFFGLRAGRIGESSVFLILAAALYLSFRKQFKLWLPVFFLLTAGVLFYLFPRSAVASDMIALRYMGYQIMGTELLFGALFLATDTASTPRSPRAAILCGILGGALVVGIRYFLAPDVAVWGAIWVMGLLAKPLDLLLRTSVFGGRRKKKKTQTATHTPKPQA